MDLGQYLAGLEIPQGLRDIFLAAAKAGQELADNVDAAAGNKVGSANESGDSQIALDVLADEFFTKAYDGNEAVYAVASEEKGEVEVLNEAGDYIVAFDPLDGSSLVDANFAVGTIIAVYETKELVGATGADLVAACYIMYGPRTVMMLSAAEKTAVLTLRNGVYELDSDVVSVAEETKYFAPGGLKMVNENADYKQLVDYWIGNSYKLRYSGGMVPDIHHLLHKGNGVFCYPAAPSQPDGKLRLVYECMPMAKIVETAGGASTDGRQSILAKKIESLHQATPICVGSKAEVARFEAMVG